MKKFVAATLALIFSSPAFAQSGKPNYEQIMECSYMVGYQAQQMILSNGDGSVIKRGEYLKKIADRSSAIVRSKTPSSKYVPYIINSTKKWGALSSFEKENKINFCVPYLEKTIK